MALIQTSTTQDKAIQWQSAQIGLLFCGELSEYECLETLENLRHSVLESEGQFISLDVFPLSFSESPTDQPPKSLLETLFDALNSIASENANWEQSLPAGLQFSLPGILRYDPHAVASPFINHAILWQRLCDLLILDDEPYRETVLVLENVAYASPADQHEIARLIRFHVKHDLRRKFIFTLEDQLSERIVPELRGILELH